MFLIINEIIWILLRNYLFKKIWRIPFISVCLHSKLLASCPTLYNPMDCSPPGSSIHGESPGKNTGVGCHALLQGIFPTQASNPHYMSYIFCIGRWILYHWHHLGSPSYQFTLSFIEYFIDVSYRCIIIWYRYIIIYVNILKFGSSFSLSQTMQ